MLWKKIYLCVLFNVWLFLWPSPSSLSVGICRSETLRQKVGSFLLVLKSSCSLALPLIPSVASVTPPSSVRAPRIDYGGLCSLQPFTPVMSSESGLITNWERVGELGDSGRKNWQSSVPKSKLPEHESGFCFNHKNVFLQDYFHERCRGKEHCNWS